METKGLIERIPYQIPHLEQHKNYTMITGLTATFDLANPTDPLLEESMLLGGADQ
jgi:hypothetical protein